MVSSGVSGCSVPGGPRGLGGASVKRLATTDQPAKIPEWASAISGNYSHSRYRNTHGQQQQSQRILNRTTSPGTSRTPSTESSTKRSVRRQRHSDSFSSNSGTLKRSASAKMGGGGGSGGGNGGGDSGHHANTPAGWRKSSIEPREAILQIASEFLTITYRRLIELGEKQKTSELLDGKAFVVSF